MMKRMIKPGILKTILLVLFIVTAATLSLPAQPPPPPPGGGHGGNSNGLPKDAPIGGGLEILVGLGAIYGALVARRQIKGKSAK
jgi:hypothetical protein